MKIDDRMKMYEQQTTSLKLIPLLPVIIRLDGKNFSKFTKGLKRPYDERLSNLMIDTAEYVMKSINGNISFTQSDEISIIFYNDDIKNQIDFHGKIFKLQSILAATATAYFNSRLKECLPEKADLLPIFDCRVWNVPTLEEAVNSILWREYDATKNSITMAASEYYSHNFLMNKNSSDKQELLFDKGINWNDYPTFFKRGTYIQRKRVKRKFNTDELELLPKKHAVHSNPDLEIERWEIVKLDLPPLDKVTNRVDVLILGEDYKEDK